MNPQDEAVGIFKSVLQSLSSPNCDIIAILRQCQHACEILAWQESKNWFYQELNGYTLDLQLPNYRKIIGVKKWDFEGSDFDQICYTADVAAYGIDSQVYSEEQDILEVRADINWILNASKNGYEEKLPETKRAISPSGKDRIILRRKRVFLSNNIKYSLSQIEKQIFDFVSSSYVRLKYGNCVKDIWDNYRNTVDTALQNLGFSNHLSTIQENLSKENPEAWRVAVLECRSLLNDFANHLWQDTRETYDFLDGMGKNGKLDVQKGNYSNRLSAYLHQKSVFGTEGKFLRDEAERLATSIRSLISVESEAHQPITKPLADTVILSTYFIMGEIALKTDLSPVMEYKPKS